MVRVYCEQCGYTYSIDLTSADIKKSTLNMSGREVNVFWFNCPRCGDYKIVNVEDENIMSLRDDFERCKARFRKYVKIGDERLMQNTQNAVNRKHKRLSDAVDKVIDEVYNGFTVATDGTNTLLVPKSC